MECTYEIHQFGRIVNVVKGYSTFAQSVKKLGVKQSDIPKLTAGKIVNGVCVKKEVHKQIKPVRKPTKILLISEDYSKVFDSAEEASKKTGETVKNIKESINNGLPCKKTGYCFDYLKE